MNSTQCREASGSSDSSLMARAFLSAVLACTSEGSEALVPVVRAPQRCDVDPRGPSLIMSPSILQIRCRIRLVFPVTSSNWCMYCMNPKSCLSVTPREHLENDAQPSVDCSSLHGRCRGEWRCLCSQAVLFSTPCQMYGVKIRRRARVGRLTAYGTPS